MVEQIAWDSSNAAVLTEVVCAFSMSILSAAILSASVLLYSSAAVPRLRLSFL